MNRFARYWKAGVALVAPGVVALGAALTDASPGHGAVTTYEWYSIAAAMILTGGAVAASPANARPEDFHPSGSQDPDADPDA